MGASTYEKNADGLTLHYGTRNVDEGTAGVSKGGQEQEIVFQISDATALSATPANGVIHPDIGELVGAAALPAGATITSVDVLVDTAFAGAGGTLQVVPFAPADDLRNAATVPASIGVANLGTVGLSTNAISGTAAVLGADSKIGVCAGTAFTAGAGTVVIKYII